MGVRIVEESRIVILEGEINQATASDVCYALLQFESQEPRSPITLLIDSPGGDVSAGWRIIDTLELVGAETICVGLACSMAAMILASGIKGKRAALKHSRIMIHQPLVGAPLMQSADFEIVASEMSRFRKVLYEHISDCTGKPYAQIEADCDRDHWLTAQEALDYGLIDYIVSKENR